MGEVKIGMGWVWLSGPRIGTNGKKGTFQAIESRSEFLIVCKLPRAFGVVSRKRRPFTFYCRERPSCLVRIAVAGAQHDPVAKGNLNQNSLQGRRCIKMGQLNHCHQCSSTSHALISFLVPFACSSV